MSTPASVAPSSYAWIMVPLSPSLSSRPAMAREPTGQPPLHTTTREVAALPRVGERKVYDLAAAGAADATLGVEAMREKDGAKGGCRLPDTGTVRRLSP